MIALQILDIRKCMAAFLIDPLFDKYSLIEAQITTFCTFTIDGRLEKRFFADESDGREAGSVPDAASAGGTASPIQAGLRPSYIKWEQVKETCFSIIKGKQTPLFFKLVLFYPEELLSDFVRRTESSVSPGQVSGLCLNLRYDRSGLVLTTGTSLTVFTPDRSVERAWDDAVKKLLDSRGISFS